MKRRVAAMVLIAAAGAAAAMSNGAGVRLLQWGAESAGGGTGANPAGAVLQTVAHGDGPSGASRNGAGARLYAGWIDPARADGAQETWTIR